MKKYIIYDPSGRIIQTGMVPASMFDDQHEEELGRVVMEGSADVCTDYVLDGVVVERPRLQPDVSATSARADGVEEVLIGGIPAGAEVSITGPSQGGGEADGDVLSFTFALPGRYEIACKFFPYQDWKVSINAI
jgi:hypothetical protein